MAAEWRRTNGFQAPLHTLQVVSWIVFGLDVLLFAVFALPLLGPPLARASAVVLFSGSVVFLALFTVLTTSCDPADEALRLRKNKGGHQSDLSAVDMDRMCSECSVVVGPSTKHCFTCNKCVDGFDHHCMWLNTCVGARNYHTFFASIISASILTGMVFWSCFYLLVECFAQPEAFQTRIFEIDAFTDVPREAFATVLVILAFINAPLFALDTQLVLLHILLISQGLTTYDYIMNKQLRKEEALEQGEGSQGPGSEAKRLAVVLLGKLDWIVFARCGRRRRGKRRGRDAETPGTKRGNPAAREAMEPEHEPEVSRESSRAARNQYVGSRPVGAEATERRFSQRAASAPASTGGTWATGESSCDSGLAVCATEGDARCLSVRRGHEVKDPATATDRASASVPKKRQEGLEAGSSGGSAAGSARRKKKVSSPETTADDFVSACVSSRRPKKRTGNGGKASQASASAGSAALAACGSAMASGANQRESMREEASSCASGGSFASSRSQAAPGDGVKPTPAQALE